MFDKEKYVTGKLVHFFPHDIDKKFGYIKDVDDLGFSYEVLYSTDFRELGTFFRSHSLGLSYKDAELSDVRRYNCVSKNNKI